MNTALKTFGLVAAPFALVGSILFATRVAHAPSITVGSPVLQTMTAGKEGAASTMHILLAGLARHNFSGILLLKQETKPVRHDTAPALPSPAQQNG